MTEVSSEARVMFEALPSDGEKISGGKLKAYLTKARGFNVFKFNTAKQELKDAGLIVLGRGRGGSLARSNGSELPAPAEKKSKQEILAEARKVKQEKADERREGAEQKQKLIDHANEVLFPDGMISGHKIEKIHVRAYYAWTDGIPQYLEIWADNKKGYVVRLDENWDILR